MNQLKIRVLHITSNLGIGGLERVVTTLCKSISKEEFEPAVCCLHFKGAFSEELEREKIPVFEIEHKQKPDYLAFLKVAKVLGEFRPHIVHTHNLNSSIDGVIASVLKRVPICIHTDHAREFPDKWHYMVIEHLLSKRIDSIIAVSDETKNNLIKWEYIDERKIQIITNGIDGARYANKKVTGKKAELNLTRFKNIVGTGVRLKEQKGIVFLIKAAADVIKKHPDTAFVIAGGGPLYSELKEEGHKLNIAENLFFLGPRLDMPEILAILDIYVLPSLWEGTPLSLLEAMAAGKAIVASNVGGIPSAIVNGYNGILAKPADVESLGNGIEKLICDVELQNRIGKNARAVFEQKFTIESMVNQYSLLYKTSLKKKCPKLCP